MGVYGWKEGARLRGNAQKIGEELKKIKVLTPENVVKKACNPDSELHKAFTWDDTAAAHQWRLQEARVVVNSIITIVDPESTEPITYRTYESVVVDKHRQYVPMSVWANDDNMREQVFGQIDQGIVELQRKAEVYRYLDEDRMGTLKDRLKHAREAMAV